MDPTGNNCQEPGDAKQDGSGDKKDTDLVDLVEPGGAQDDDTIDEDVEPGGAQDDDKLDEDAEPGGAQDDDNIDENVEPGGRQDDNNIDEDAEDEDNTEQASGSDENKAHTAAGSDQKSPDEDGSGDTKDDEAQDGEAAGSDEKTAEMRQLEQVQAIAKAHNEKRSQVDLLPYFPADELASMGDLETTKYRNMILNYEFLTDMGIKVAKPCFMQPGWRKPVSPPPTDSEIDSAEEWTPAKDREKTTSKKRLKKWNPPTLNLSGASKGGDKQKKPTKNATGSPKSGKRKRRRKTSVSSKPDGEQNNKARKSKATSTVTSSSEYPDVTELMRSDSDNESDFEGFSTAEVKESEVRYQWMKLEKKKNYDQDLVEQVMQDENSRKSAQKSTKSMPKRNPKKSKVMMTAPPSSRYPRRSIPRPDYAALEMPADDHFIYCDDCEEEYLGDCPEHGPLIVVEDTETFDDDPNRADNTVPPCLTIRTSKIFGAGSGVWSTEDLSKGMRFGPYAGVKLAPELDVEAHESGYCWMIFKHNKPHHYVDAQHVSSSNWMRYVNCARGEEEQNLLAFQYDGNIYYRTLTPVKAGQELLVWYGEDYARELGITEQKLTVYQMYCNPDVEGPRCEDCGALYSTQAHLLMHQWTQHGRPMDHNMSGLCKTIHHKGGVRHTQNKMSVSVEVMPGE